MSEAGDAGVIASARVALATLIEILRTRLQILGLDLEEHGQRLVQSLVLALIAACLFIVGVVCAGVLVTLWLWQSHRLLAVAFVFVLLFGGAALSAGLCLWRLRARPRPFAASLAELRKDLANLRGEP